MIKFKAFELEGKHYVAFEDKMDGAIRFDMAKQATEYAAIQNIYWFNQLIEAEFMALKRMKSNRLEEVIDYLPASIK